MKKVTKDDVKKFWSEHKLEIISSIVGGAIFGIAYNVGFHECSKQYKNKMILKSGTALESVFKDAVKKYSNGTDGLAYTVIEPGFTAAELGKLGDKMLKNKCGDDKFTHFILLGPNPER